MKETFYNISTGKISEMLTLLILSDFHNGRKTIEEVRLILQKKKFDAILIPGDICSDHLYEEENSYALEFLKLCAKTAPTYYTTGNHEWQFTEEDRKMVRETGVHFLDNTFEVLDTLHGSLPGVLVGGLTSTTKCGLRERKEIYLKTTPVPDLQFLKKYEQEEGFKILLSHQPEYYPRYLKDTGFDLIVSGHAHGGQIRLGKRVDGVGSIAVYAPGQGLFPKLTAGVHDGRLVISRGLTNSTHAPRFGNPTEAVFVHIERK